MFFLNIVFSITIFFPINFLFKINISTIRVLIKNSLFKTVLVIKFLIEIFYTF